MNYWLMKFEPGIAGMMKIVREGYPDHRVFDSKEKYFDPKSDPQSPRWHMVDVHYVRTLKRTITWIELLSHHELTDMLLVWSGNRLSVMSIKKNRILSFYSNNDAPSPDYY